jgi:hypothetical protein
MRSGGHSSRWRQHINKLFPLPLRGAPVVALPRYIRESDRISFCTNLINIRVILVANISAVSNFISRPNQNELASRALNRTGAIRCCLPSRST